MAVEEYEYLSVYMYADGKEGWKLRFLGNVFDSSVRSALFSYIGRLGWKLVTSDSYIGTGVQNLGWIPFNAETSFSVTETTAVEYLFMRPNESARLDFIEPGVESQFAQFDAVCKANEETNLTIKRGTEAMGRVHDSLLAIPGWESSFDGKVITLNRTMKGNIKAGVFGNKAQECDFSIKLKARPVYLDAKYTPGIAFEVYGKRAENSQFHLVTESKIGIEDDAVMHYVSSTDFASMVG